MKHKIIFLIVFLFLCGQAWAELVVGTSCGLVTTAPTSDPEGGLSLTIDYWCRALKITPSENRTITEIGWYSNQTSEEANFEVAIYSHNAGDDVPDASIYKDQTNAKGTGAGWKVVSGLNIELTASTVYWIVIQCDPTTTDTRLDGESIVGQRVAYDVNEPQLQDPWNQTTGNTNAAYAIYALYEGAPADGVVDTLQPVEDGDRVEWDHTGCDPGERYDCVDDPPGSPDGTDTYAYTSVVESEYFGLESTVAENIDSIVYRFNAKGTGAATKLYTGFAWYTEDFWQWQTRDSITLTDSWADYSVKEDEIQPGYPWTDEYINERRFGVRSVVETPADSFGNTDAVTTFMVTSGYIGLYRYQATFTGTIDTLSMYYLGSPDGSCKMAIYSDSGTNEYPYELLDTTASFGIASGWNRHALVNGNVSVTENDYYWLSFRASVTFDSTKREAGPTANCGRYKGLTYTSIWPDPIPSGYTGEQVHYRLQAIDGAGAWGSQLTQVFLIVYTAEAVEGQILLPIKKNY